MLLLSVETNRENITEKEQIAVKQWTNKNNKNNITISKTFLEFKLITNLLFGVSIGHFNLISW